MASKSGVIFIQVNICFSTTSIDTNAPDVKYRRAPPSRVLRDSIRAKEHHKPKTEHLSEQGVMDRIPDSIPPQTYTILEPTENVNDTEQVSCAVFPPCTLTGGIVLSSAEGTSHDQLVDTPHIEEVNTQAMDTGNIDTKENSIDLIWDFH